MKKKGFTLVELIAVIALLGILVITVIPNIIELFNQAKQNSFENDVRQIYRLAQKEWVEDSITEYKDIVYARCSENCSNELQTSGRTNVDYYVKVDKDGNIIRLFATDGTYQYEYKGNGLKADQISNSKQVAKLESNRILKISNNKIEKDGKDVTNTQDTIPTTTAIYWALQDNNVDGKNETLVLSNSPVFGNKDGNFSGYQVFNYTEEVPWIKANYLDKLTAANLSYDVTNIKIEGEIAPAYTLNWFNAVGYNSDTFTADLSNLNLSNVTNAAYMFSEIGYNASNWSITGLSNWDTSKVEFMSEMFKNAGYNATNWSLGDISNWNTSKVSSMNNIFDSAGYNARTFNVNLSSWDTSNLVNGWKMFYYAGYNSNSWSIGNISNWNTSKFVNMSGLFSYAGYNAETFNLDLSGWDTSSSTSMYMMFDNTGYNAKTFNLNLTGWDTSKITDFTNFFHNAGYSATSWSITGLSNWNTSSATNMSNTFYNAGYNAEIFNLDLSGWDTTNVNSMYYIFNSAGKNATNWSITGISNWDTSKVTKTNRAFYDAGYNAGTFNLNLSGWNTSSNTDMYEMFRNAGYNATTWNITIPNTNGNGVSNTTSRMFGASNSTYIDASNAGSGRSFTLSS